MISLMLVTAYAIFLLWGEWRPHARAILPRRDRWLINIGSGVIAITLSYVIWGFVAKRLGLWSEGQHSILEGVPAGVRWVILIFSYDLALYGWHRLNHENSLLWRYHRFHHLDSELDTTSALRFHWLEFFLTGFWRVPFLWILHPTLEEWSIVAGLGTLAAGFHHGRAWLPAYLDRFISLLLVTPRWHWAHHHPERKFHDAQYGILFIIWDRLFASVSLPPDSHIGLKNEPALKGLQWQQLGL